MINPKTLELNRIFLAFFLIMTLSVLSATAQELSSKLVTTEWLWFEVTQPKENLRIIDLRDSIKHYWQGHIPGAVYFSPEAMRLADQGVPVKLTPPEILAAMLGKMGINERTMIIVYTEQGDYKAPYLIWALDYLGHEFSAVLDGGFEKWQREARPVTQDYPKIEPTRYRLPHKLNQEVRAGLEEVKQIVDTGGAVLLDVRPNKLYAGEAGPWKRKGHIKGAINHFWGEDLTVDGTWKSKEDLGKGYEMLGATPDKLIIVSCGQGQMSAHSYFTLKHILGYPRVKNYDGSFNEWSNIDELPIGTGP
jgi:thiosulfate/3-mercaptopyruvate sulfurtransferase